MQSLEVSNYLDAKEVAGILAMNGYQVTVAPVDNSYTNCRPKWRVVYIKEGQK